MRERASSWRAGTLRRSRSPNLSAISLPQKVWPQSHLASRFRSGGRLGIRAYIVSAGYFAGGLPGAVAGWLAMITPALLVILMVHFVGRRMEHPRVRSVLQTVVIASAGLLLAAAIPLGGTA